MAADCVEPRADGLDRIQSRIEARRRLPSAWHAAALAGPAGPAGPAGLGRFVHGLTSAGLAVRAALAAAAERFRPTADRTGWYRWLRPAAALATGAFVVLAITWATVALPQIVAPSASNGSASGPGGGHGPLAGGTGPASLRSGSRGPATSPSSSRSASSGPSHHGINTASGRPSGGPTVPASSSGFPSPSTSASGSPSPSPTPTPPQSSSPSPSPTPSPSPSCTPSPSPTRPGHSPPPHPHCHPRGHHKQP